MGEDRKGAELWVLHCACYLGFGILKLNGGMVVGGLTYSYSSCNEPLGRFFHDLWRWFDFSSLVGGRRHGGIYLFIYIYIWVCGIN